MHKRVKSHAEALSATYTYIEWIGNRVDALCGDSIYAMNTMSVHADFVIVYIEKLEQMLLDIERCNTRRQNSLQ